MGDKAKSVSPHGKSLVGSPAKSPSPAALASSPPAINETAPLDVDENPEEDDLGIAVGAESDTTSLKSSILRYREENGRTYHSYKDGAYIIPNDDMENDRLGDENPDAQITGIDLSPIQPAFVPPNVRFLIDDVEDDWEFSTPFDFIFARMMTGSIKDFPRFFQRSFENLEPGGWIELQDSLYPVSCDDGTMTEDSPLLRWSILVNEAFRGNGSSLDTALLYEQQLADAGFVNIHVVKEKWPVNRWPKDKRYKQLGIWGMENGLSGLGAMSLAALTRPTAEKGLGWTREEVEMLNASVRREIKDTSVHIYVQVWMVYAQKPE